MNIITNVPNTYKQTINSEDSNEWKLAIKEEISNMYNNNVMEVVNKIPKNVHIIDTKWIFTEKDDNKKKGKTSLVVSNKYMGKILLKHIHQQFKPDSLRLIVGIASLNEWNLKQLDIKAVYLNADLEGKYI